MQRCLAVSKKGATDQCKAKHVFGHTLCGRHARSKNPVLWVDTREKVENKIEKIQANIRGWLIRKRLLLGGPGVLNRKIVVNDEDIVTYEEKTRQHPFDYIAFEDNGKVWWFDFDSLWKWTSRCHVPVNPYTKNPIKGDVLKRLHSMWGYRQRHKYTLPTEPEVYEERILSRCNIICQIFANYGFGNLHPNMFSTLGKIHYHSVFHFIRDDIGVVLSDTNPLKGIILRYCSRIRKTVTTMPPRPYSLQATYALLLMLTKAKDPYIIAFTILSALYRC